MDGQPIKEVNSAKYVPWYHHQSDPIMVKVRTLVTLSLKQTVPKHFSSKISKCAHPLLKPPVIKLTCIQPILEYAAIILSPYNKCDITKIEKVQCQATRFVFNDFSHYSSVTAMMKQLNWPFL